jgi:UDP-N-acetylmuramoyl-tripeptide--D-alanyl-D-alanine ligase
MTAALKTLDAVRVKGKKVVVLGDMFELGPESTEEHRRIGILVREMKFENFYTVGTLARNMHNGTTSGGQHYERKDELTQALRHILHPGDAVLVKGSRGMKMEEVVAQLSGQD